MEGRKCQDSDHCGKGNGGKDGSHQAMLAPQVKCPDRHI
jgi:hypothetical protein